MQEKYCQSANKFPKIDVVKRAKQQKWVGWAKSAVRGWLACGCSQVTVVLLKF